MAANNVLGVHTIGNGAAGNVIPPYALAFEDLEVGKKYEVKDKITNESFSGTLVSKFIIGGEKQCRFNNLSNESQKETLATIIFDQYDFTSSSNGGKRNKKTRSKNRKTKSKSRSKSKKSKRHIKKH